MASRTLLKILNTWVGDPTEKESPLTLPFNVEMFCRENDLAFAALEEKFQMAMNALAVLDDMSADLPRGIDSFLEEAIAKINGESK